MAENNENLNYIEPKVNDDNDDEGDTITLGELLADQKEMEEVLKLH